MSSALDMSATKAMFLYVAEQMIASKNDLTKADQAIGDGDHGIGMARGFAALTETLNTRDFATLDELFKSIGMTLMSNIGGASGAIFGTLFRGAAKSLVGKQVFDTAALAIMLKDGLQAVQARGNAKPGDKTMVDALLPASQAVSGDSLLSALAAASAAAEQGMEKTKQLVATTGKAKTLGERSLGHADPGAISTYLILKSMHDFLHGGK